MGAGGGVEVYYADFFVCVLLECWEYGVGVLRRWCVGGYAYVFAAGLVFGIYLRDQKYKE